MKPKNIAFIGGGINSAVGEVHKISCQLDGRFKLVAGAFSRDNKVNLATAEKYGLEPQSCFDDWQQLIEMKAGELDALAILTPTPAHSPMIKAALKNNLPVICEKALCSSVLEAEELLEQEKQSKGFVAVTYNYSGYPMLRELKARIEQNQLGFIHQVQIEMPQDGFIRLNPQTGQVSQPQEWRSTDLAVPTVSLDLGVHIHQMVSFLTGRKPVEALGIQRVSSCINQVVDNVQALVNYDAGMECHMWYGKTALGYRNGLRVRLFGEQGSAEWLQTEPERLSLTDQFGVTQVIDRVHPDNLITQQQRYNRFKVGHPAGFIEAFANYYSDIYDAIENGASHWVDGVALSVEGLKLLQAIHESADKKGWVALSS